MTRALVLAGGGLTGIAWETGVIAALHDVGIVLTDADLVVGTSAGAAVAAQITSGAPIDELVGAQLIPASESKEMAAELDIDLLGQAFGVLGDTSLEPDERRARVGAMALAADTITEAQRRDIIEARLPRHEWPDQSIILTAVDAHSGALTTFERSSGVELIDAVAASCAVPCVWPPVTIGDRRYIDGGVRSGTNADLAIGHDVVVVITPEIIEMDTLLEREVAKLEREGSAVEVVRADGVARREMGPNALDPTMRAPALAAGRRQGSNEADRVRAVWGPWPS
jgi:NTE family protein